ncbi:MAG: flagellar export protein FliJ [Deltaproteobacteria bacterium]
MKAFQFRLQTKLTIALRQEQLAREELQRASFVRDQIAVELAEMMERLADLHASVRMLIQSSEPFERILIIKEYIPIVTASIQELELKLIEAEQRVEECRQELLEKKKETRTMERLKEKAWMRYLHELQLEEQKLIDEVANTGHYRSHKN